MDYTIKKMLHDNIKKTIYYNSAIIKVYDFPIFYFPKLSHPDPSVKRRSGFLVPTFMIPKIWEVEFRCLIFDLGIDKNFTLTNRLYLTENPLILGEYHQAFNNANLLTDFGYTEGYKKTSRKKKDQEKNLIFFQNFVKNYRNRNNFENSLELNLQEVSNDKYLKLYKIESNLVDYNIQNFENSLNLTIK